MKLKKSGSVVKSEELEWKTIDGETLILDSKKAKFYKLNQTGTVIWNAINSRRSKESVSAMIAAKYKISRTKAEKDVAQLLSLLKRHKLIK